MFAVGYALSMVSPVTALAAEESAASEERETVQVYADTEEENDSGSAEGSEGGEPVEPPAEKQEQVFPAWKRPTVRSMARPA